MNDSELENPYILLTPGPLSTSPTVRKALLRDWCTWDDDYNLGVVTPIREKLAQLAAGDQAADYTAVLMQGSGSFSVEAMIGTAVPRDGKLLILANGAYGDRLATIASYLEIDHIVHDCGELAQPDQQKLKQALDDDAAISHVVLVHNETTTGMLNPLEEIAAIVKAAGRILMVDAMSSFGGIPIDVPGLGIDYIVSSANKCIQGVPGFGFVVCRRSALEQCGNNARSLSLDLFDQWRTMETGKGKWRFTSPTHTVRAFAQAMQELEEEGGIPARFARYTENHRILIEGMEGLGFKCILPPDWQSPIITGFHSPDAPGYTFQAFYDTLKTHGFVIYPGKVTGIESFRIGTIGHVFPDDIARLIEAVEHSRTWIN
jgi:2-aminoethylphosphonate-pyruvate transaminase